VEPKPAAEKIRLRFVTDADGAAPTDWRESPIVLLGDSHTLVFHAGEDMHGTGAGLADQLALELGFPVDVVGVRGSGATPARINLLRRKDNLAGKKLVIWCFSAREFTEATGGWRLVPVIGKK
jgi:alginate O-acetyltransferase complex protein AlgJ